tara:strand:+ start:28484 stop:30343 length:1860 start_codon:yes stop_codon:yes gene_type:complete
MAIRYTPSVNIGKNVDDIKVRQAAARKPSRSLRQTSGLDPAKLVAALRAHKAAEMKLAGLDETNAYDLQMRDTPLAKANQFGHLNPLLAIATAAKGIIGQNRVQESKAARDLSRVNMAQTGGAQTEYDANMDIAKVDYATDLAADNADLEFARQQQLGDEAKLTAQQTAQQAAKYAHQKQIEGANIGLLKQDQGHLDSVDLAGTQQTYKKLNAIDAQANTLINKEVAQGNAVKNALTKSLVAQNAATAANARNVLASTVANERKELASTTADGRNVLASTVDNDRDVLAATTQDGRTMLTNAVKAANARAAATVANERKELASTTQSGRDIMSNAGNQNFQLTKQQIAITAQERANEKTALTKAMANQGVTGHAKEYYNKKTGQTVQAFTTKDGKIQDSEGNRLNLTDFETAAQKTKEIGPMYGVKEVDNQAIEASTKRGELRRVATIGSALSAASKKELNDNKTIFKNLLIKTLTPQQFENVARDQYSGLSRESLNFVTAISRMGAEERHTLFGAALTKMENSSANDFIDSAAGLSFDTMMSRMRDNYGKWGHRLDSLDTAMNGSVFADMQSREAASHNGGAFNSEYYTGLDASQPLGDNPTRAQKEAHLKYLQEANR